MEYDSKQDFYSNNASIQLFYWNKDPLNLFTNIYHFFSCHRVHILWDSRIVGVWDCTNYIGTIQWDGIGIVDTTNKPR